MLVWLGLVVFPIRGVRRGVWNLRYVGRDRLCENIEVFVKLLLTVRCGTGLVSDGELCYNIVRYRAVLCAGIGSWSALCRNVVVVRDGATQI